MNGQQLREAWVAQGALVIARHDFKKTGLTLSAVFPASMVSEVARGLLNEGYFLEDLSAMQVKEGLLITYHYDSFDRPGRVAVRALADAGGTVLSICSVYQGAQWHEREASDFTGIRFIGNTNPVPLLLAADFPDPPPLLKAGKDVASMSKLLLFGDDAEILDPAWRDIVSPPAPASEEGQA